MITWTILFLIFFVYFVATYIITKAKTYNDVKYAAIVAGITSLFVSIMSMILLTIFAVYVGSQRAVGIYPYLDKILYIEHTHRTFFLLLVLAISSFIITATSAWIFIIAYPKITGKRIFYGLFIANLIIGALAYNL